MKCLSKKLVEKNRLVKRGLFFSLSITLIGFAIIAGLLVSASLTSAQTETYQFITKWGSLGTADGDFDHPYDIILDSSESILFISDTYNHRIQKFTTDGKFISSWGTYGNGNGQLNFSMGLAIDSIGNIYVADTCNNRVQIFTRRRVSECFQYPRFR